MPRKFIFVRKFKFMFYCMGVGQLNAIKSPECKNAARALAMVGQYSVSGGPVEGPGGPNGYVT